MNIVKIHEGHLFSVKYDDREQDEYTRLLYNEWQDIFALTEFFYAHKDYLNNNVWKKVSIPELAVRNVVNDANLLSDKFAKLRHNTDDGVRPDYDSHFKYLDGQYKNVYEYTPMKSYGVSYPSFIRLYAIKIDNNCYIITGGGLKLSDNIDNSPGMGQRIYDEIERTKRYLTQNGISAPDDI